MMQPMQLTMQLNGGMMPMAQQVPQVAQLLLPTTALTMPVAALPQSSPPQPSLDGSRIIHVSPSINLSKRNTKMCRNHKNGYCAYGEGCTFAHEESDKISTRTKQRKIKKKSEKNAAITPAVRAEAPPAAATAAAPAPAAGTASDAPTGSPVTGSLALQPAEPAKADGSQTPRRSPGTPESSIFDGLSPSQLVTPVILDRTPHIEKTAEGLKEAQLTENDHQFLQRGEQFALGGEPSEHTMRFDTLSLCGGGLGGCSIAGSISSSKMRYEPYGGTYVMVVGVEPTEAAEDGGADEAVAAESSRGPCTPAAEDGAATFLTPRGRKPVWQGDHSPSDQMLTGEASSASGSELVQEA